MPGPATAQLGLGEIFEVDENLDLQREPQVALGADGGFSVLWTQTLNLPFFTPDPRSLKFRLFDAAGAALGESQILTSDSSSASLLTYSARIDSDRSGAFVVSYQDLSEPQTCVRAVSVSPSGERLQDFPLVACNRGGEGLLDMDIAVAGDGTWLTATEVFSGVAQAVDLSGNLFDISVPSFFSGLEINPTFGSLGDGDQRSPALAAAGESFVAAWEDTGNLVEEVHLDFRRFAPDGSPLGGIQPAVSLDGPSDRPRIAGARDGGFALAWQQGEPGSGDRTHAYLRFFDAMGEASTPELLLAGGTERWAQNPAVTLDSRGNALAVWTRFDPVSAERSLEGRFFDRRGAPQSDVLELRAPATRFVRTPDAALHDRGGAMVVWGDGSGTAGVLARRLQAPRDDELCVNRGRDLLCDTANNGGGFEASLRFGLGVANGDVPLVGDIDGDGDDDFCLRRNALFLCDADGRGAPAELKQRFGRREHGALLGDLDGDGDDDPCLRIGRRLVCDTAHDGPPAEVREIFGAFGEDLLLGDINGDGRDDACVYRSNRFLCDPAHQGSPASFRSDPIGSPAATPLLGDVDGDGRDDLCALEPSGELLCDTQRDGSTPVSIFLDVEPGDLPLLGNIDAF